MARDRAGVSSPQTLTRVERRSIAFNRALVAVLRRDPERVLAVARRNLRRLQELHPFAGLLDAATRTRIIREFRATDGTP